MDPSAVMLEQHRVHGASVASPSTCRFADDSFDAALGVFTVHHWTDQNAGLAELQRVSRRQVILTFDQRTWSAPTG